MASRFEMSPGEQVNTEWRRCPGSMERRAIDSVAPLRQSSAGWMPARMGRLSACVGRRHPVTIRKAALMAGSMRPVRALRYQTGAQYSAVGMDRGQGSQRSCPRTPTGASKPPQVQHLMSSFCEVTRSPGGT